MPRPYFQASIKSLEALFEQHADETGILAALLDELERRNTPKAINLKGRVVKRLAAKKAGADASNVNPTPRPRGTKTARITPRRKHVEDPRDPSGLIGQQQRGGGRPWPQQRTKT